MNYKIMPVSKLIFEYVYGDISSDIMAYIIRDRLSVLDTSEMERVIERDRELIIERGPFKNNYIFMPSYKSLEEIYDILFREKMFGHLTFSEQVSVISLFEKVSKLLKGKEKKMIKEIDKLGRNLEHSIVHSDYQSKIDTLTEQYNYLLSYWNILNKLEFSYRIKMKSLNTTVNYMFGVDEDILEASILKIGKASIVLSKERKLVRESLVKSFHELEEFNKMAGMSKNEQDMVKKLTI